MDSKVNSIWDGSFILPDFPEHVALAKNFESVKVHRVRVTVVPMQSVSNNSTSVCPGYIMTPWHYPIDLPKTFNAYLSCNRAKLYRQTQVGKQVYVPSLMVMNAVYRDAAGNPIPAQNKIEWRPEVRTLTGAGADQQTAPRIFCGAIAFQGDESVGATKTHFNIKMDVWVTYKNQTTMLI